MILGYQPKFQFGASNNHAWTQAAGVPVRRHEATLARRAWQAIGGRRCENARASAGALLALASAPTRLAGRLTKSLTAKLRQSCQQF